MSKKLTFNTPGRECSHADSGCCPSCYDPAMKLPSTREYIRRVRNARLDSTQQKESSNGR